MADDINNVSEDISYDESEDDIVTLTDEDGVEYSFRILCDYQTEEGDLYYALEPVNDDKKNKEENEYTILKVIEDENGDEELITIEDDDEFERIGDIMDDILNSDDFDNN